MTSDVLRTPDGRFAGLPGWPYAPHHVEIDGLRVHYVDEGPRSGPPVLLLHGEPSWAYLYRTMIPVLAAAGFRVVAPDLVGFGRSDKPTRREDYTYARHIQWMQGVLTGLDLSDATLFGQDWGGLVGLRLVAADPDRWARVVVSNTFLPTGERPLGAGFERWRAHSQETPILNVGKVVSKGCARPVPADVVAAYDAPFPDETYKAGARQFPMLVPDGPDAPEALENRAAWQVLRAFTKPFLTLFGAEEKITLGAEKIFQSLVPGAAGQPHALVERAAHFIQEDAGPELAERVVAFAGA